MTSPTPNAWRKVTKQTELGNGRAILELDCGHTRNVRAPFRIEYVSSVCPKCTADRRHGMRLVQRA